MICNNIHTKKTKKEIKEEQILKKICKECGKGKATLSTFCIDCLAEMKRSIFKN